MAVFGKVSDYLAPRDAIDNEFFRWLMKPKGAQSNAAASPPRARLF
jgi:hypothetical protein